MREIRGEYDEYIDGNGGSENSNDKIVGLSASSLLILFIPQCPSAQLPAWSSTSTHSFTGPSQMTPHESQEPARFMSKNHKIHENILLTSRTISILERPTAHIETPSTCRLSNRLLLNLPINLLQPLTSLKSRFRKRYLPDKPYPG